MQTITRNSSLVPLKLDQFTREELAAYFQNTWDLYEWLFSSIQSDETYYLSPDPLRNPLIFYLGHTAAFYINKMRMAGLLEEGLDAHFEHLFAVGVDPDLPENLEMIDLWPTVDAVRAYRKEVFNTVMRVIENTELILPVTQSHPLWTIFMGLEHDRIHFETSSVLIRQLDVELVEKPEGWEYAPTLGMPKENSVIAVEGGRVKLGKPEHSTIYGWDNEFGKLEVSYGAFEATKNLITNAEYLEFVESGAYNRDLYWTKEGLDWKKRTNTLHPKFWLLNEKGAYGYRAMFDILAMPMDWPVEVNAHEALAYCAWKGEGWRLLSEAEFTGIANKKEDTTFDCVFTKRYNLNMAFGSPTPVGYFVEGTSVDGFTDLFGNVWDWLSNDFYPLPGFEVHPYYEGFSKPFFDEEHSMLLGGAWVTTGTGASKYYRLWFRRHFFQHAGFRMARSL